jgi:prepilin signal peptidase PulO-like enzyme (type II secretory pathway)
MTANIFMTALITLYVFIIGTVIGSFVNVIIYRLPNNQSIVRPRSHCPNCNTALNWKQLLPILSYIIQRGKCSNCHQPISKQYPLIEFVAGIIFVLIFIVLGFTWLTLVYWILAASCIAIFMIDYQYMIIPDKLNLFIFILGIITTISGLTIPVMEAIYGSILGGGILWLIAIVSRGGMGGGDIKFAFAIGLFTGWKLMLLLLFVASLLGCVYGIINIISNGYQKGKAIPFGPFLVISAMIVLLWGQWLLDLYITLFVY